MDAMVREDIVYPKTKPNFKKIMEKRVGFTTASVFWPITA